MLVYMEFIIVYFFYFKGNDISSDDVQFDTDNETNDTLSQRRTMIFTLLDKGLLADEDGTVGVFD